MTDLPKDIEALTHKMHVHILGMHSAVAMGALMNLVMTVAQHNGPAMRGHMAYSFRNIADQLDAMNGAKQ
jgi:hypothetical protein